MLLCGNRRRSAGNAEVRFDGGLLLFGVRTGTFRPFNHFGLGGTRFAQRTKQISKSPSKTRHLTLIVSCFGSCSLTTAASDARLFLDRILTRHIRSVNVPYNNNKNGSDFSSYLIDKMRNNKRLLCTYPNFRLKPHPGQSVFRSIGRLLCYWCRYCCS